MEEQLKTKILNLQEDYEIIEGSQWFQGLHAVFAQTGTTCLALSSQSLGIHHTPKDRFDLLSLSKIKNRAEFIYKILKIIEIELSY
jgi:hypothetical protein